MVERRGQHGQLQVQTVGESETVPRRRRGGSDEPRRVRHLQHRAHPLHLVRYGRHRTQRQVHLHHSPSPSFSSFHSTNPTPRRRIDRDGERNGEERKFVGFAAGRGRGEDGERALERRGGRGGGLVGVWES